VLASLALYFLLSLTVLVAVFLLFTFFETLRLAASRGTPAGVIPLYLLYLIPYASTVILPIATMLCVLATYALMARRNEAVSWWSTGQSFYRLALPSLIFSLLVCAANYGLQERLLPEANQRQNALRSQIRGEPARAGSASGLRWLAASDGQIYSYRYREGAGGLDDITEYKFDDEGIHLREVARAKSGRPTTGGGLVLAGVSIIGGLDGHGVGAAEKSADELREEEVQFNLFKPMLKQPNEYDTTELRMDLKNLSSPGIAAPASRVNALRVALWKRWLEPLDSLVLWINALPLALAFGRRSVIRPLALAVLLGLCFWLGNAVLSQAGTYGLISPQLAVLALPAVLSLSGIYLLSKART
jgi:lipopolysaccharide export LptBFGC system permease protein LptF